MDYIFPTTRRYGSVPGVANGALLNIEFPNRGTHYELDFLCKKSSGALLSAAEMMADIDLITVYVNGAPKMEFTATELFMLQKHYGDSQVAGNVAGVMPIFLYARNLKTWLEKAALAYGMLGVDSFVVSIKLAASLAQLASIDYSSESTNEKRSLGTHLMYRRFGLNYNAQGDEEITSLLKDTADMAYKGVFFNIPGSSTINYVSCKVDGQLVYDMKTPAANQVHLENGAQKPQTGWYKMAFDANGDYSGRVSINGVKDFRPVINWGTANPTSHVAIAELYAGLK